MQDTHTRCEAQHRAVQICLPADPPGRQVPAHSATEQANGAAPQAESPLKGKTVVIIGAGGAGRALVFGAAHAGAHVVIANRCRYVPCCAAALHRCAGPDCIALLAPHVCVWGGQMNAVVVPGMALFILVKQVCSGPAFSLMSVMPVHMLEQRGWQKHKLWGGPVDWLCRSRQKAEDLAAAAGGRADVVDLQALLSGAQV